MGRADEVVVGCLSAVECWLTALRTYCTKPEGKKGRQCLVTMMMNDFYEI